MRERDWKLLRPSDEQKTYTKRKRAFGEDVRRSKIYDIETKVDNLTIRQIDWVKTAQVQASKSQSKASDLMKRYMKWEKSNNGKEYWHHQRNLRQIATFRNVINDGPSCRA